MKMKVNYTYWFCGLLLSLLVMIDIPLLAETPNASGAKKFAETFFKTNGPQFAPGKIVQQPVIKQCYQSQSYKGNPVFVFQNSEKGFAVVAQRNSNFAVVGYSPEGKFTSDNIPVQLKTLLKLYEDSLSVNVSSIQKVAAGAPVATPLLDEAGISLNQFSHDNAGNCPTGCVATAFTQIMCYYKYPSRGVGSHCYTHFNYGQLCADFGNTTYNWNNPTDDDYKLLSYHVGVAMEMNYCGSSNGSAPYNWGYEKAMHTYFNYYLNNGSTESYFIQNAIDNRRPVYIELPGVPGHALVVDGYDTNGLFHLNFGWGGQYNGYYVLNSNSTFNVGYKFGTNISAAYFITPQPLKTNVQDSLALVAVNTAFNGTTGWDLSQPVSTWNGVLVMNGRVIALNLNNGNYLVYKGSIPSEIGNLTALQTINLLGQIDGTLPATITNLTQLRNLNIFAGAGTLKVILPENIGNLTNLETLLIPYKCEGTIPASIGNLTQLERLDLNSANLTGNIPAGIGNLTSLTSLNLRKNRLAGSIPSGISNLINLTEIYFDENQLTGSLPDDFGNLTNLVALALNDNRFSGTLPESLGNCNKLLTLNVYNNQFSGEIPASLGNLLLIKGLNFSNNKFTALPEEMGRWINLEELNLNNNFLSVIPDSIENLVNLKTLYANNNQISALPANFGFLPSLLSIDLSFNKISEFPDALCQLPKLQTVTFRKNKIAKFPPSINLLPPTLNYMVLDSNEIKGVIPKELLENANIRPLLLSNNRFTFEDIPSSTNLKNSVGYQKPVNLNKKIFKVGLGDTINIDIRDIAPFTLTSNEYNWILASRNKAVGSTPNPVLTVVIDEKTIENKYFCSVSNPSSPTYSFTDYENTYTFPCLYSVSTDTLSFQLASENELIAEKYAGGYVVSAQTIPTKIVEDKTVTLVPSLKARGNILWQASSDGATWYDLSETMSQNDLKSNFISVKQKELILSPKTPAFYRCRIQDINCEPIFSDTIKVNPFGQVLYDETINVSQASKTISVDSIEVTLPANIYDKDFRLTVVKLDNQPESATDARIMPAYDVTVSFAETFDIPLVIKLKNVNKKQFDQKNIHNYKAVYLDKNTHEWIPYEKSYISLQDTTMVFETNHLTVISVCWWDQKMGYDAGYERNNINVFYKTSDEPFMKTTYDKKQTAQSWHVPTIPLLVQDITEYLFQVREVFKSKGFPVPEKFNVYIKTMDDADGVVGISGMINDYLTIHTYTENPLALRSLLAHEYMHYTQGKYMSPDPGNIFWMEANAHLTDRLVWDESVIPVSESEKYLLNGIKSQNSIFNFLSNSWDYWDKGFWTQNTFGNVDYCYMAGTFLHYMRTYTQAESKLDPVALLKETTRWSGDSWLTYLSNYVAFSMNSLIGDEYENYVKYILSTENKNFTLLNKDGNPFSNIIKSLTPENDGTFAKRLVYKFASDDNNSQTDNIDLKLPYLSSKVLLLYNQTPDRAVVVTYKRLHEEDSDNKVYYGKYDFKTKQTVFVDISDSTKYNIFIEARSDKSVKESQNICFLLLVNKSCKTTASAGNDFNASFELNALPVLDIEYLYTAWIAGDDGNSLYVHTNSGGEKDAFLVSGVHLTMNSPNVVSHVVNYYSSNRSMTNDSSYVVNITFGAETRSEYDDIGAYPGIQISDKQIKIEYNYITSTLKLYSNAKFTNKFEKIYEEKPIIVLNSIWYDNTFLSLKDINTMTVSASGENVLFRTNNSAGTQAVVEKISSSHRNVDYDEKTGEPTSESTKTYVSTDYSGGDVVLKLLLKLK